MEEERISNVSKQEVFGVELYEREQDADNATKYILKKGNTLISVAEPYDEKRVEVIVKKVFGN